MSPIFKSGWWANAVLTWLAARVDTSSMSPTASVRALSRASRPWIAAPSASVVMKTATIKGTRRRSQGS